MKIQTVLLLSSLLLTSCTVTAQQTKDKEWAVSIKPDGTGVNIQPTQPQATTSPTTSVTPNPVFSPSPSISPSPLVIATPTPSFTPKITPQNIVTKPSPVPIVTQPIIEPCSKFTYQSPRILLTLKNGILSKKVAIPSCKIQSFLITGISGAELIVDGGGAGVAIIKGNNLLTQSSKTTKGIATLSQMVAGQYKIEIVSRENKFYTVIFETKKGE
ncbi:MAG TPA: hypothetical protein V6D15_09400 [Oculatellaceae cyanobacterium]|jgi:hypothetical protein